MKEHDKYEDDSDLFKLVVSSLIVLWLILATMILSRMLRSETEDWTLTKNNGRLLVVVWGFITAYSSTIIFAILVLEYGYKNVFQMSLLWLLIPALCNYIPISLVLYLHFRNVHSLGQVILKWVKSI